MAEKLHPDLVKMMKEHEDDPKKWIRDHIANHKVEAICRNAPATIRFYDGPNGWQSGHFENGQFINNRKRCEC